MAKISSPDDQIDIDEFAVQMEVHRKSLFDKGILRMEAPVARKETIEKIIKRGLSSKADYKGRGRLFASSAAFCSRQGMLTATYEGEDVVSPSGAAYMTIGSAIEELIVGAMYNENVLLFKQYKLPDIGINLGGYVDAIALVDGKIRVFEIKTCGELPIKPKIEHERQALIYAAATGLRASVLYFSRGVATFDGNLKTREFVLEPTRDEMLAVMFTACYAHIAIEMKIVPPIPTHIVSKKDCGFCRFKSSCWEAEPPLPGIIARGTKHAEISKLAAERAEFILSEEEVITRRNGVLKHLQLHGTTTAAELLADADWPTLY